MPPWWHEIGLPAVSVQVAWFRIFTDWFGSTNTTFALVVANFIGGLAVGATFIVDLKLGIMTWLVAAAHEVPQELGDFGALVHGGWAPRRALLYNFMSANTFLVGGLVAYATSRAIDLDFLVAFAAGNFLYIGAVDLVPEINKHHSLRISVLHFACLVSGMGILLLVREIGH